jgi:phosphatidylserine/phosphatidylglycerophosphate/cardiolipin synthase-like enzyme
MTEPAPSLSVLEPLAFLADVEQEATRCKKRFYAQAMEVEGDEVTTRLFHAMSNAAKRGVDTRLNVDWYSLLMTDNAFNYLPAFSSKSSKKRTERQQKKKELYANLTNDGVKVKLINKPGIISKFIPTYGRNHMKMVIIDDSVWIGGVNFNKKHFHFYDFMAKLEGCSFSLPLSELFERVHAEEVFEDYIKKIDDENTLYIDGGKKQSSIIFSRAQELVRQAKKSVKLTSAFYPDGNMLKELHAKWRQHIPVEVITTKLSVYEGYTILANAESLLSMRLKNNNVPIRYLSKIIHSKLLIVDDTVALFGSHNFTGKGVIMRTGELALQTSHPVLVKNLLAYYDNLPHV